MTMYACLLCGLRAAFDKAGCDRAVGLRAHVEVVKKSQVYS